MPPAAPLPDEPTIDDPGLSPEDTAVAMGVEIGSTPLRIKPRLRCPSCWHSFSSADVLWIARDESLRGDLVAGRDALQRFLPTRFNARGEALDAAGRPCQQLACPRCHLRMPRELLERDQLVLSLVGVPGSGKSYLLAAMSWELRRQLPQRFGVGFADVDPELNEVLTGYEQTLFLQENRDEPVYIEKTELQGSHYDRITLGGHPVTLTHPFIFALDPPPAPRGGEAAADADPDADPPRRRVLCLFDDAGEHFHPGADHNLAPGTQHVAKASALLFLYDPLQDPRFRDACRRVSDDPQLGPAVRTQRQDTVMTEAATRIHRYAGLSREEKLRQPLIVLVGKADVWLPLLPGLSLDDEPWAPAPEPDDPTLRVDTARVEAVSARVRAMLAEHVPEFVAAAELYHERVMYIPLTALGQSPVAGPQENLLGVRPRDIRPAWVTVPVLYALSRWSSGYVRRVGR